MEPATDVQPGPITRPGYLGEILSLFGAGLPPKDGRGSTQSPQLSWGLPCSTVLAVLLSQAGPSHPPVPSLAGRSVYLHVHRCHLVILASWCPGLLLGGRK